MSVRDSVLEFLEKNRDTDVSGERLAGRLGVSRTAIWKAVCTLKAEGYPIEAATNRGYRLLPSSDRLSAEGIRPFLRQDLQDLPIRVFQTIDSTHTQAKREAADGPGRRCVLLAERQTAGRGRFERSFYSPEGCGIYMSVSLTPNRHWPSATLLTTAAAVAVCRAVEALTGLHLQIKWVNDLFLDGKKVCGILTEAVWSLESGEIEGVILSPGLNVKPCGALPDALRGLVGALFEQGGPTVSRNRLAAEILNALFFLLERPSPEDFLGEYRARSLVLGREIVFVRRRESIPATALDIDGQGGLIVRLPDGRVETLCSGEVSLRLD
jgi:BirA family biotin operon repressor/biotin-[acetyl-CoA-carboxylase] ligase